MSPLGCYPTKMSPYEQQTFLLNSSGPWEPQIWCQLGGERPPSCVSDFSMGPPRLETARELCEPLLEQESCSGGLQLHDPSSSHLLLPPPPPTITSRTEISTYELWGHTFRPIATHHPGSYLTVLKHSMLLPTPKCLPCFFCQGHPLSHLSPQW